MRKLLLLSIPFFFAGCGSIRELLRPVTPRMFQDSLPPVVAPSFSLTGKAAQAQDSLRERLLWISRQKAPSDFKLDRIAFLVRPDSTLTLALTFQDDFRVNSHGLGKDQVRQRMQERLRAARPLASRVREAGIDAPILLRSSFRSRDFLFQNARWVDDTASWPLEDSTSTK
ncbi:MAG: hypothetical protein IPK50_21035 [Fibrobacterota bacterium]|nr:hypothetical protein [Fibrobacterota bacterium]QQS04736.1 MAG: hypothetical protein IPK50_21035 [Fibrobacterota bacterium]